MKRIKKTLCLMLVLALALGMVPAMTATTAVALDFEDADDIGNINAAKVNNALGIIVGDSTGFRPGDTLIRAEAATIITRLLIGADYAKHYEESTASSHFTDVSSNQWWSGVIMYTYERGIMYGTNASGTRFTPRGTLTIPEFAIMLMRALGKATTNDYRDGNWRADAVVDATKLGLLAGLGGDLTRAATRDIASQMAFNALVYSDASAGSVTKYQVVATVSTATAIISLQGTNYDTFQAAMSAAITAGGTYSGAGADFTIIEVTVDDTLQSLEGSLANTVHGLRSNRSTDAFERPVTNYTRGNTTVVTITDTPVETYIAPVTLSAIRTAYGITGTGDSIPVFLNGGTGTATGSLPANVSGSLTDGGHGVKVELYGSGNNRRIVVIETNVGIVSVSGTGTNRVINASITGSSIQAIAGYRTSEYAAGNVITFEYSTKSGLADVNARVHNIKVLEPIAGVTIASATGTIGAAAAGTGTFVAGGDTHRFNKVNFILETALNATGNPTPQFDLYKDADGYVVLTRPSPEAAIPSTYLYVTGIGASPPMFGTTPVYASVIFDDGETAQIQTNIRTAGNTAGAAVTGAGTITTYGDLEAAFAANPIAFYSVTDNVYTLTRATGTTVHSNTNYVQHVTSSPGNLGAIANGSISLSGGDGGFGANTFANANTKFVVGTPTAGYTAYNGFSAVPSVTSAQGAALTVNNRAIAVFATTGTFPASDLGALFISGVGRDSGWNALGGTDFYEYNVVNSGEIGTLRTTQAATNIPAPHQFVFASAAVRNNDGYVTAVTGTLTNINALTRISAVPGTTGVIQLTAGTLNGTDNLSAVTPYQISATATIFFIDGDGVITKAEDGIEALDSSTVGRHVAVVTNTAGTAITALYVFELSRVMKSNLGTLTPPSTLTYTNNTPVLPTHAPQIAAAGTARFTVTNGWSGTGYNTTPDPAQFATGTAIHTITLTAVDGYTFSGTDIVAADFAALTGATVGNPELTITNTGLTLVLAFAYNIT